MTTFIMLTRLSTEAATSPLSLEDLEHQVMEKVRSDCPDVKWLHSYAILGPYDYLDIFEAPDIETRSGASVVLFGKLQDHTAYRRIVRHSASSPLKLSFTRKHASLLFLTDTSISIDTNHLARALRAIPMDREA